MTAQINGATLVLMVIAQGHAGNDVAVNVPGQNGFGPGDNGEYTQAPALIFEIVARFLFVAMIRSATHVDAPADFAEAAVGPTRPGIHLVGINVTGVSVNPARSIRPATVVGGKALAQLWVFIVAPLPGGLLAGALHGARITRAAHRLRRRSNGKMRSMGRVRQGAPFHFPAAPPFRPPGGVPTSGP